MRTPSIKRASETSVFLPPTISEVDGVTLVRAKVPAPCCFISKNGGDVQPKDSDKPAELVETTRGYELQVPLSANDTDQIGVLNVFVKADAALALYGIFNVLHGDDNE